MRVQIDDLKMTLITLLVCKLKRWHNEI